MTLHGCMIVAALLAVGADGPKEKKDKAALLGAWKPVRVVEDGQGAARDVLEKVRIVFKEDSFTTKEGEERQPENHLFKINAKQKPRHIEVMPTVGPNKDKMFLGIYKIDGDEATICVAYPGTDRPTKFESKRGSDTVLMVLERVKKK